MVMSYCGNPQVWPPSQPPGTPLAPSFWLFQSSMTKSAPQAATVNPRKNAGTTNRVIGRYSFEAMIPSPRARLARFDPCGQVALGCASVQDAKPGLDGVRWRQGGPQRRGGETGQACPCRRFHQGDAAARAPSPPEGRRRRRPTWIRQAARVLYEDLTPPESPRARQAPPPSREPGAGRPTKRERRDIERLRGR